MIRNLGKVLTILISHEVDEHIGHLDIDAFAAPSECHALVSKGEAKRWRRARKHAEAVARRPYRIIEREAARRGFDMHYQNPRHARAYDRIFAKRNPFQL